MYGDTKSEYLKLNATVDSFTKKVLTDERFWVNENYLTQYIKPQNIVYLLLR